MNTPADLYQSFAPLGKRLTKFEAGDFYFSYHFDIEENISQNARKQELMMVEIMEQVNCFDPKLVYQHAEYYKRRVSAAIGLVSGYGDILIDDGRNLEEVKEIMKNANEELGDYLLKLHIIQKVRESTIGDIQVLQQVAF